MQLSRSLPTPRLTPAEESHVLDSYIVCTPAINIFPQCIKMDIPKSYESLTLENIKISHHPPNTPDATAVVVVTLNRPEKFNAFTPAMAESLTRAFQLFHYDSRVRAIVLTGAGKMFCAGSDLSVGFGDGKGRAADFRDMYV